MNVWNYIKFPIKDKYNVKRVTFLIIVELMNCFDELLTRI